MKQTEMRLQAATAAAEELMYYYYYICCVPFPMKQMYLRLERACPDKSGDDTSFNFLPYSFVLSFPFFFLIAY